jgi:hypothetical protein
LLPIDETNFKPLAFDGILIHFKPDASNAMAMELKRGPTTTQFKRIVETKQP